MHLGKNGRSVVLKTPVIETTSAPGLAHCLLKAQEQPPGYVLLLRRYPCV